MPRGNGGVIGPANIPSTTSAKGIWSLTEVALAVRQSIWPAPPVNADPFFEYTTLLLPGNGTNGAQNNTFLDGSTNNFTITRNGNTTQGTFSPFSQTGWGNYFNGSSRLSSTTGNVLNWGTNNFTVEMWVYLTTTSSNMMLLEGPSNNDFQLFVESGILKAGFGGAGVSVSYTLPLTFANTWNHIAVVRSGTSTNQTALYVNGVSQSTGTWSSSGAATGFQIARTSAYTLYGYVSGVRVIQNQALTSGNFTPPTAQVTTSSVGWTGANVAGSLTGTVSLLLCTSNRFVDSSGTVSTITIGGSPTVVAFSPFNPTASWSAATYGGSGYFDGNGDALSAPASSTTDFGTSDFTIEAWVYLTSGSAFRRIYSLYGSAGAVQVTLRVENTNTIRFYTSTVGIDFTTTATLPLNAWSHIAVVRNGSAFNLYLNGESKASGTSSSSMPSTSSLPSYISGYDPSNELWFGYISNLRIVKGTAVYTSNFTPPTAPLTAITNTSLLLNFTNAGIYDATSKNDLETVGNAQISTAISAKWGSGSISVGTGNYLIFPNSDFFAMGSGDFTIEFWIYPNNVSTAYQTIFRSDRNTSPSTNSLIINFRGGADIAKIAITSATTQYAISPALTASVWQYVAVVRSGGSTTVYVNGTGGSSVSTPVTFTSVAPAIGYGNADPSFNGYIQDFRITKGVARSATTPTAAFPIL